ncbi:MAG: acyl-CoA dehydrogenase family protein [Pseudomonadota bacterium]
MAEVDAFRTETRQWLEANFPPQLKGKTLGYEVTSGPDGEALELWRSRLADRGWGAPTWPVEYGGAGLTPTEAKVLAEELASIDAMNPIPLLAGMGVTMVGPTVLEYGTQEQKAKHLPGIASGAVRWCLGLSEPNAGSDLASLATRAVDEGDNFVINGQKIWTSGANISQWCGAVVRTDASVAKRKGISFVMLPMDQAGVRTRPISLISGDSPFCETFFDDAVAEKADLLGELNDGWSVVKRLLQHERQSQTGSRGGITPPPIEDLAKTYVGLDEDGELSDPDLRLRVADHLIDAEAHQLTVRRIRDEAKGKVEVSAAASILKNSATGIQQGRAELLVEIMGTQALGWAGDAFTDDEIASTRQWLSGKAISIYGGSREVQNNIISKNILGLPETTQQG